MKSGLSSLDLNLDNYTLDDILRLFKVPVRFTEVDLKKAKSIVLKTHPDKSGLGPEFFIFYKRAYERLFSVWEFRKKGDINAEDKKNTDYSTYGDDEKRELLDDVFRRNESMKSSKDFNRWFNEQFDKSNVQGECSTKGYEDWLRSPECENAVTQGATKTTMESMGSEFERRKREARSVVVREEIQDLYCSNTIHASTLSQVAPTSFDSDMFSSLPFQDLRQAHTDTVIPVTMEDYEKKEKFSSVDEMIRHRGQQDTKPLSEQQALSYLRNREKNDEDRSIRIAFDLARQTELAQQRNQEFWSSLQTLRDKG
jgi:hypothetical protein